MSLFRDTVEGRRDKEIYILLSEKPIKVKLVRIIDDMLTLTMLEDGAQFREFYMHIDNVIIVETPVS